MAEEISRLSAILAERMRELRADPNDPRLAPLFNQMQALLRAHVSAAARGHSPEAAAEKSAGDEAGYGLPAELADLLRGYLAACPLHSFAQAPALSESGAGRALLALPPADKVRMVVAAYDAWCAERFGGPKGAALRRVVSDLLRGKLPLADADAIALAQAAAREGFTYASYSPNQAVLGALERHVAAHGLSPELRRALQHLLAQMTQGGAESNVQGRKLRSSVEALLAHEQQVGAGNTVPLFRPKGDPWSTAVSEKLAALPGDVQGSLGALLALAREGGKNAKPAKGWLKSAGQALDRSDRAALGAHMLDLIECHEPGTNITLENQETIRALLWLAAMAAPDAAGRRLEAFAQTCLTFSAAHFAYLSLVLGNASIHAFSLMPGTAGVGSLSRLRRRLKRPGEIKTVDKALAALAQSRGMNAGELEEIGMPDYGFSADGRLESAVGPAAAVLAITDANTLETSWRAADGSPLKGPPADVKASHAEALKEFKARAKEIGETLKAQCARLERLYLDEREWPLAQWRARYLDEPLVSRMARRLVWSFKLGERWIAGLPMTSPGVIAGLDPAIHPSSQRAMDARVKPAHDASTSMRFDILDAGGTRLDLDTPDIRVRLWHPMQSEASHVLAWRQRLAHLGVTQPFKQAHREIYVLTDAERETHTYSNRFAGHIAQQHLFRALCQARGWNAPAFGSWCPGDSRPKKMLPGGLQADFWVEPIEGSLEEERFQFLHLATDQVRFANSDGELVALEQIPPVVFSEIMRDVDLFVGVSSIGNDPTWGDRGVGQYGEYWNRAAFGPLGETAKTRHAVLHDLLPGLTIANQCRLEERFLVVSGKLRTYRIHLGSSNVMMQPNDQYLCVVQDHQNAGGRVRLPFEGDTMLSVILSKAFLLAEDDKIKDRSIVSQIKGG